MRTDFSTKAFTISKAILNKESIDETPGPGFYNTAKVFKALKPRNICSAVLRPESVQLTKNFVDTPGPGFYNNLQRKHKIRGYCNERSFEPMVFPVYSSIGPGCYKVEESIKKIYPRSSSAIFKRANKENNEHKNFLNAIPGPGTYITNKSQLKSNGMYFPFQGHFFVSSSEKDLIKFPGPTSYDPDNKDTMLGTQIGFKFGKSARPLTSVPKVYSEYDIIPTKNKIDKGNFTIFKSEKDIHSISAVNNINYGPGYYKSEQWKKIKPASVSVSFPKSIELKDYSKGTPGPGTYFNKSIQNIKKGISFTKFNRFKKAKIGIPPAGDYKIKRYIAKFLSKENNAFLTIANPDIDLQ